MVMRAILLAAILIACLASTWAASKPEPSIRIQVDDENFFLGETVIVDIEATGLLEPLDLAALEWIGEVGRRTIGTRIAVIAGQVVEIQSVRIELTPRRAGDLVVGPVTAGHLASNAIAIRVEAQRPATWVPDGDDAQFSMTVTHAGPRVQEEIMLDIRLRHRHPVFEEEVILPSLAGLGAVPVFAERRTLEPAEGGWGVIAWRYLLHPERSGPVEIGPARFAATLARSRSERARIDFSAGPLRLTVKPAASGAGWWLPARAVRLRDEWSSDPTTLSAGDEVERTITVEAEAVRPEQIPDIVMADTRGLLVAKSGEERTGTVGEGGIVATARFSFRIRAISPVAIFVDTIRLPWWDTSAAVAREAIIPARRIEIGMPDREKLIEAAGGDRWISLVAAPNATSIVIACLVAAAAATAATLIGTGRDRTRRTPARAELAEASSAIRRLDPAAAVEALRRAARRDTNPEIAILRERLEIALARGGLDPAEVNALAAIARSMATRRTAPAPSRALPLL
jgi:hypothetical protein